MAAIPVTSLTAILAGSKSAIINQWLELALQTCPVSTSRSLSAEKGAFLNPFGCTFEEGLSAAFEGLIHEKDIGALAPVLYDIVKTRAVQSVSASQAVSFVFLLKHVIRGKVKPDIAHRPGEMAALDARIDDLALLAFDVFMRIREQICELRVDEIRRATSLAEQGWWLVEEETIG